MAKAQSKKLARPGQERGKERGPERGPERGNERGTGRSGILPAQAIRALIETGGIKPAMPIAAGQIQYEVR